METHEHGTSGFTRQAVVTFAVVALAVAALDDITTDRDTSFTFERIALAGCGAWFLLVARQLWRRGYRAIGGLSFGLLAIAALAQPAVGQGRIPTQFGYLGYIATITALAWFLALAGILAAFAWRQTRQAA